jgi:hypothetical protein
MKIACILVGKKYEAGSMPPNGYLAWHEWAEAQHKAGLRQVVCARCGKYKFPQELSGKEDTYTASSRKRKVTITQAICKECA